MSSSTGRGDEGLPLHEVAVDALLVLDRSGFRVQIPLVFHDVVAVDGRFVGEGRGRQRLARLFPDPATSSPPSGRSTQRRSPSTVMLASAMACTGTTRSWSDHGPGGQRERRGGHAGVADAIGAQGVGAGPGGAQHEAPQVVGEDPSRLRSGRVAEHDHGSGEGRAAALLQHAAAHDLGGGVRCCHAGQDEPGGACEQRAASPATRCRVHLVCHHRATPPDLAGRCPGSR